MAAIERELRADGFVHRYSTGEGGSFLASTFGISHTYALVGHHAEARDIFKRMLVVHNNVGLLAEEYDMRAGARSSTSPRRSRTSPSSTPPET